MGAVFRVPIEHAELPPEGPNRVALVPGAERAIWQLDLSKPTVFVVGAERHGLPAEVVAVSAAIPQAEGAESLNAAAAATVALYEAVRQRA